MRLAVLSLMILLAACGPRGGDDEPARQTGAPVQTAELTGLYEGQGESEDRSRICMISESPDRARFGLVTFGPNGGACSGEGEAVREGERLRLAMGGDEECAFDATLSGPRLAFPSQVPESCAYYCSQGATLAGETFDKTAGTAEDARRAADLAGDPLCS